MTIGIDTPHGGVAWIGHEAGGPPLRVEKGFDSPDIGAGKVREEKQPALLSGIGKSAKTTQQLNLKKVGLFD